MCGEIVIPKTDDICKGCKKQLKYIKEPRCKKCSKPVETFEEEYCFDCLKKEYNYIYGMSLWLYDHTMKKSISDFKYKNKLEFADFYVKELVKEYESIIIKIKADALVPVPIHKSKLRSRGYNQAEILADKLGSKLNIDVYANLLLRDKKTLPQKSLSDKERLKNLIKAFSYNKEICMKKHKKLKTVILVDDIYTTGSTIEACTNVLMNNGISNVYFISLCIGNGY